MSFSDDDAISSGDDFSLYPATFSRRRPQPEDRLFYDTADEISLKIINCEHICCSLYHRIMNILRYTSAPEHILDDMDRHAKDIEKKVTLYNNNMHMIIRKFYSNDCPDCARGALSEAITLKENVTQFSVIATTRFDELRDASAPFLEPPAKRSRVRMTESRNARAVEPEAEAEAEDCAGPGIVPGPLVASGRMGPGLCQAWD